MTTKSKREMIVAIDGYSSCGKSTFAKAIAARLGYIFIDTGAMYRAVTFEALRRGAIKSDQEIDAPQIELIARSIKLSFQFNEGRGVSEIYINEECVDPLIRSLEVTHYVSRVSAIGGVRSELVAAQQAMGAEGGVVMDGRDIGTVVFPDADIKLFMTADPLIRAQRRYDEQRAKGDDVSLEQIVISIKERDRADETRAISPLQRADDAITLDNSNMSVEQQMEWFLNLVEQIRSNSNH